MRTDTFHSAFLLHTQVKRMLNFLKDVESYKDLKTQTEAC